MRFSQLGYGATPDTPTISASFVSSGVSLFFLCQGDITVSGVMMKLSSNDRDPTITLNGENSLMIFMAGKLSIY